MFIPQRYKIIPLYSCLYLYTSYTLYHKTGYLYKKYKGIKYKKGIDGETPICNDTHRGSDAW